MYVMGKHHIAILAKQLMSKKSQSKKMDINLNPKSQEN